MTEPCYMSKAERVAWEMFRWQAVPDARCIFASCSL
jgi:hypothetical protein